MVNTPEEERLRRILDMARAAVNQLKPELAMEYLQDIRRDVEALSDNSVSAEYEIITGDALAARRDQAARYHYEQALTYLRLMHRPEPKLQMIAHEHFGTHLRLSGIASEARREFEAAAQVATSEHFLEENARIRLKLVLIDLEMDHDPKQADFQVLRKVAARKGSTNQDQLAAWHLHVGNEEHIRRGMCYARQQAPPPEQYFEKLLDSVKTLPR